MRDRNEVVKLAKSWLGKNEKDGSYKSIIDIYNSYKGKLPRGLKMQPNWSWCACTWSALAIKLGYTDIMPIEISCGELIKAAKNMGIWVENDGYVPTAGDAVLYDWDDNGKGDNAGWPDHVGVVEHCDKLSKTFIVIEGNYQNSVKKRTMTVNGKFIRGFICPKYDDLPVYTYLDAEMDLKTVAYDVIAGKYGSGETRKDRLEALGYDPEEVQAKVNDILNKESTSTKCKTVSTTCKARFKSTQLEGTYKTTANLYCRYDAGTNKKAMCKFPKGATIHSYGYYNVDMTGKIPINWLLVQGTLNGILYTGFCSSQYLKKV